MSTQLEKDKFRKMLEANFARDTELLGQGNASLPPNYEWKDGKVQPKPKSWMEKYGWLLAAAPMTAGIGAAFLAPAAGASAAGGGAAAGTAGAAGAGGTLASTSTVPLFGSTIAGGTGMAGGAGATGAAGAAGAAGGIKGGFDKTLGVLGRLKAAGLDPNMLGLGALSLLGGDDGPKSYTGAMAPQKLLENANSATMNALNNLQNRGNVRLRSSYAPAPPAPISIPGIPFQIGGGLGRNPALADPSLLEGDSPVRRREPK